MAEIRLRHHGKYRKVAIDDAAQTITVTQCGLTLPSGIPCCRQRFDKYPPKKKAVLKSKSSHAL